MALGVDRGGDAEAATVGVNDERELVSFEWGGRGGRLCWIRGSKSIFGD